jgi:hypothetical protein
MGACSDPTYEPGPVALLDTSGLEGPLEPPTLAPIAQSFAESTGPWLSTLDAAYDALALEQGLDLTDVLGGAGSDALASAGFTGVTAAAPAPRIARTSTVIGPAAPATLTVVVTDATNGVLMPQADIVVLQYTRPVADASADSAGRASFPVTTGAATTIVSRSGYLQQIFSVQIFGDTTVTVALVPGSSTPVQGDQADAQSQLAVLHDALIDADGALRRYWTYTGGNPHP